MDVFALRWTLLQDVIEWLMASGETREIFGLLYNKEEQYSGRRKQRFAKENTNLSF